MNFSKVKCISCENRDFNFIEMRSICKKHNCYCDECMDEGVECFSYNKMIDFEVNYVNAIYKMKEMYTRKEKFENSKKLYKYITDKITWVKPMIDVENMSNKSDLDKPFCSIAVYRSNVFAHNSDGSSFALMLRYKKLGTEECPLIRVYWFDNEGTMELNRLLKEYSND